ncbi:thioredoxin domain-containing protein 17 isoform X1 [Hemitrygon akajei]|uniref:thioredoxin domain-containing protein 17 isoform X1 n=1 Tax=Hemitrygon akajei TaxID=2704970 RepID=UPI003BF98157
MAIVEVSGYDEFMKAVERNKGKTIYAYFTGSKDTDGVSWCPDCVKGEYRGHFRAWDSNKGLNANPSTAKLLSSFRHIRCTVELSEPVVRAELGKMPEGSVFIYCQTGTRPEWKDLKNKFRTELKINGVPTLMKYGTPQKLVEEELFKPELVKLLITED